MPWFVVYRSKTMNRETRSPPCPTEGSALTHPRALYRAGAEVFPHRGTGRYGHAGEEA